ncbi:hypothetical protein ACFFX0_28515 [Citricoccus parietis]|uniref:Uncharacterized protein n=1 Tax=Citricoccus parietis TaxID=592307 RepID=A0ABV5G7R0_9MICC
MEVSVDRYHRAIGLRNSRSKRSTSSLKRSVEADGHGTRWNLWSRLVYASLHSKENELRGSTGGSRISRQLESLWSSSSAPVVTVPAAAVAGPRPGRSGRPRPVRPASGDWLC